MPLRLKVIRLVQSGFARFSNGGKAPNIGIWRRISVWRLLAENVQDATGRYQLNGHTANTVEPNYKYSLLNRIYMFFNEKGILNIDEAIVNNASFKNIMEDGIVTEEEVKAQSDKVVAMLHDMETKYSQEQLEEIKSLLAETSVLYAIYNFYSIQNIDK